MASPRNFLKKTRSPVLIRHRSRATSEFPLATNNPLPLGNACCRLQSKIEFRSRSNVCEQSSCLTSVPNSSLPPSSPRVPDRQASHSSAQPQRVGLIRLRAPALPAWIHPASLLIPPPCGSCLRSPYQALSPRFTEETRRGRLLSSSLCRF